MKFWPLIPLVLLAGQAAAQEPADNNFIPTSLAQSDRIKVDGWDRYLKFGLTGNISDNKNVVGKTEGQTSTYGGKVEGALDYKTRDHEWLNSMNLLLSYSRTPQLDRTIKADDTFDLESLYKYYLSDFSGLFARFNLDTSLAPGYDEREEAVTYLITKSGGDTQLLTDDRLNLTDGLRPMRLRESVGVFTNLLDRSLFKLDIKGGLGLRQVTAARQRVIDDNADTDTIEVDQLQNSAKAGYEVGSDLTGATDDKRFSYKISFNALFPFYETPDDNKTGSSNFDKRVLDLNGKLSYNLTEWASLDYNYKMIRDPSILQKAQVAQTYLFSINHVLVSRREAPAPAAPATPAS